MYQNQTQKEKYVVGEGSFGRVYKYCHEGKNYAIKKIFKKDKNFPELLEKIEAEGKILQKVSNHRNVVEYMGQMNEEKHLYLLTEFIAGGDLRKIDFLPSQDDLWEIVMQIAMGLHHLKKNKVVHRDIKPENILLKFCQDDSGEKEAILKLTDFGLAEILEGESGMQGIAGSPIYLAPQMVKYESYSYSVDMWSFGITLYQLAHNQRSPYSDDIKLFMREKNFKHTQSELFNFLVEVIKSKRIKCSSPYPLLNMLIEQILVANPKQRPTPVKILQHPKVLERIIRFNKNQKNNLKMVKTLSTNASPQPNQFDLTPCSSQNLPKSREQRQVSQSSQMQLFLSSQITNSFLSQLQNLSFQNQR